MRVQVIVSAATAALGSSVVAMAQDAPDITGVWSGSFTTQDNPYWQVEDFVCFPGCPRILHDTLKSLLDDPANAGQPDDAMMGLAAARTIEDRMTRSTPEGLALLESSMSMENLDLASYCAPYGFVREAMNALPVSIRREGENLVFDYEEFSLSRTIHMDGSAPPADLAPAPLGWSSGRYEDGALIVETVGIAGDYLSAMLSPTVYWGRFADGATAVERYVVEENPRRLVLDLTLTDPVTLTEPYVWTKTWLYTPDVELLQDSCEDVPGQFEEGGAS